MEEYNISVAKMSGDMQHHEKFKLVIKKYKSIPYGFKNYNNKICTDVSRMISRDLTELEFLSSEKSTKKALKKILILTRKFPTCYFYVKEELLESEEENNSEEKTDTIEFKSTGGYDFWYNLNDEKIRISTYSEAMELHLQLLKNGDYKMSEFFLHLAKKMTDNPTLLYQSSTLG